MDDASLSPSEAADLLGIPEEETGALARPDGRVSLQAVREHTGATALELARELARELVRAREEAGRLAGQLKEVRATNSRLLAEAREDVEERRRLTEEVLELRAAAEERLMLMERIERIAHIEQTLAESEAELERLRSRRLLARLFDR